MARNRTPQRVFWMRRVMVFGTAFALIFAIGRLFIDGTGTPPPAEQATKASAKTSAKAPAAEKPAFIGPQRVQLPAAAQPVAVPEIPPAGPCLDNAITTTPEVPVAVAGGPITINLQLTGTSPACSFKASSRTLAVKITSGSDEIWSSQDCPVAIPEQDVVVRAAAPTTVPVTWSGRRSDADCTKQPGWAMPGIYHVMAATLGSAASDAQFEVTKPGPRVVVKTQKPKPTPNPMPDGQMPRIAPPQG